MILRSALLAAALVTGACATPSMLKVTVPAGVPAPGALVVTVAVKVTGWPNTDGLTADTIVVVVEAPEELRVERLVARGLSEPDARARIAAQATDTQRREIADHILDNSADLDHLTTQVEALWHTLKTT